MENQENKTDASSGVMKKCPDCGKEVSARATSCPNCGAPLNATIQKCPDCGKDVSIHASSCPNCGRPLEAAVRTDIKPVNMGFSLLALPIIIALCSWASTKEFGFWSATSLFVFIFAVFIGIEAYRNRKIKDIGNPLFWSIGALFLFPIIYPYYMFKRKEIRLDSVLKWVSIPLAVLTMVFWIASYNQPRIKLDSMSNYSADFDESDYSSSSSSAPSSNKLSFEEVVCRKAKEEMTEHLAGMEGSNAPACTSVTIVKKVSKTRRIGKATASNGKSGEISIDIMAWDEDDPDPALMVMPVDITDFHNPFE